MNENLFSRQINSFANTILTMPVGDPNPRPHQRSRHPSRMPPNGERFQPGNPSFQSNSTVGSRYRVETGKAQYTWKFHGVGGLSSGNIEASPILGSRGDFNRNPIARIIADPEGVNDPDIEYVNNPNLRKLRYKSKNAIEGAFKRNNWVIYVQLALKYANAHLLKPMKYPEAISDIVLQGMFHADPTINPMMYRCFNPSTNFENIYDDVLNSLTRGENYFTTNRDDVIAAYRRCIGEIGSVGENEWDRFGDHSTELDQYLDERQQMLRNPLVVHPSMGRIVPGGGVGPARGAMRAPAPVPRRVVNEAAAGPRPRRFRNEASSSEQVRNEDDYGFNDYSIDGYNDSLPTSSRVTSVTIPTSSAAPLPPTPAPPPPLPPTPSTTTTAATTTPPSIPLPTPPADSSISTSLPIQSTTSSITINTNTGGAATTVSISTPVVTSKTSLKKRSTNKAIMTAKKFKASDEYKAIIKANKIRQYKNKINQTKNDSIKMSNIPSTTISTTAINPVSSVNTPSITTSSTDSSSTREKVEVPADLKNAYTDIFSKFSNTKTSLALPILKSPNIDFDRWDSMLIARQTKYDPTNKIYYSFDSIYDAIENIPNEYIIGAGATLYLFTRSKIITNLNFRKSSFMNFSLFDFEDSLFDLYKEDLQDLFSNESIYFTHKLSDELFTYGDIKRIDITSSSQSRNIVDIYLVSNKKYNTDYELAERFGDKIKEFIDKVYDSDINFNITVHKQKPADIAQNELTSWILMYRFYHFLLVEGRIGLESKKFGFKIAKVDIVKALTLQINILYMLKYCTNKPDHPVYIKSDYRLLAEPGKRKEREMILENEVIFQNEEVKHNWANVRGKNKTTNEDDDVEIEEEQTAPPQMKSGKKRINPTVVASIPTSSSITSSKPTESNQNKKRNISTDENKSSKKRVKKTEVEKSNIVTRQQSGEVSILLF